MKKIRIITLILSVLTLGIILSGCSNNAKTSSKKTGISIITTTDFYGEVAKKVVGNKGSVKSIINNPAVDPHDYEPTTSIAKDTSRADILIANGLGYDSWMNKLSNDDNNTFIKVGEDVMHKKTGDNPHIWYNPQTMPKFANYLADQLAKKYPKDKKYFKNNAKKYIKSLEPVDKELTELKAKSKKVTNKNVYVSEPVFDYSIQDMGFKVGDKAFEKAIEDGTDPSPTVLKNMRDGIKQKKIAFLVINKQTDSKTIDNLVSLANKNDIPILKVTETLPSGDNYKSWMLSQYKQLNKILDEK